MIVRKKTHNTYQIKLQSVPESTEALNNPGCGWYQMYTLHVEEIPDLQALQWCMEGRLVQVLFHIGAFRDRSFDDSALSHMEAVLSYLQEGKKDVILRIVYDNEGKGMEKEPGMFSRVLSHIDEFGPLLRKYRKSIYIYQGLLVGSWGEMHSSKFLGKDQLCRIHDKLREYLGADTYIALRRPMYYRRLQKVISSGDRVGLYDDGMFGSQTHLGTFGLESREYVGWESPWNRKEEMAFIKELCCGVPNGGETVLPEDGTYPYSIEQTVQILQNLRVSYLNRHYHPEVLSIWRRLIWEKRDNWRGMNGKEYIGRHLGYRFRVIHIKSGTTPGEGQEKGLLLWIQIKNDGFSNCYEKLELFLQLRPKGEKDAAKWRKFPLEGDLCSLEAGKHMVFSVELPNQEGSLFLGMRRQKDGLAVRFANPSQNHLVPLGTITAR